MIVSDRTYHYEHFQKKGRSNRTSRFRVTTPTTQISDKRAPFFQTLHLSQSTNLNTLIYRLYMILYTLIIYLLYHLPLLFEIETFSQWISMGPLENIAYMC